MIGHETPGVEYDAVNLGLFTEMCKKRAIQTSIDERPTPPKCGDGDEIAPGFRVIEPLQARGFPLGPRVSCHRGMTKERELILRQAFPSGSLVHPSLGGQPKGCPYTRMTQGLAPLLYLIEK
jgi:hypothetical protein